MGSQLACYEVATGRAVALPDTVMTVGTGIPRDTPLAHLLGPAFFDPQLNGFAGVDFQDSDITGDALEHAMAAMRTVGCAHCLVTLITNSAAFFGDQLARLGSFLDASPLLAETVLGFHLEGPFFTNTPGYIGAHPPEHARAADVALFDRWQRASGNRIRMFTLGPEVDGALELIRHVAGQGICVCAGHTDASLEQLRAATAAGLRLFTHLGNGCAANVDRHDSIVQRVLSLPELSASVIPDGVHLPPFALRNLTAALGRARLVATTDAASPAAAPAGTYTLGKLQLEVGADRIVRNPGGHGFAGSSLLMVDGFYNLIRIGGLGAADAWHAWTRLRAELFPGLEPPLLALPFPGSFSPAN